MIATTKQTITEDIEQSQKNIDNFISLKCGYFPKHNWIQSVQNSHYNIRKFLGGIKISYNIKLESKQKESESEELNLLIDKIFSDFPNLDKNGYDKKDFLLPSKQVD